MTPPNKWFAFSTSGMTAPSDLATALNTAYTNGYTGQAIVVPNPAGTGAPWIAVAGYGSTTED